MATFVLVHPAWMGGWCWDKVAAQLRELGNQVYAPTLTGLAERAHLASPDVGLTTHVRDVASVVVFDDLRDVILVGTQLGRQRDHRPDRPRFRPDRIACVPRCVPAV